MPVPNANLLLYLEAKATPLSGQHRSGQLKDLPATITVATMTGLPDSYIQDLLSRLGGWAH